MQLKVHFYRLLTAFVFIACNNNGNDEVTTADTALHTSPVKDGTYVEDSVAIPIDTTQKINAKPVTSDSTAQAAKPVVKNAKNPEGIYQTILPCYDCKGIEHTVAFYPDLSYRLEDVKMDKEKTITKASGYFRPTGNTIWLYKDQIVQARYTWKNDTLQYIEPKTNKHIALQELTSAAENTVWRNKQQEGIDFYGVGNEPFWNVEINNDETIAFQLADWTAPKNFLPGKPVSSADSIHYQASADSVQLKVTIYQRFCRDGMSDYIYPQAVKVVHNNETYRGCGILFQ